MRIRKLSLSIVLLTALIGLSIACSKRSSDDTIAKDIQDKVAADPDTKDSQVSVAAKEVAAKTKAAEKSNQVEAEKTPAP